MDARLGGVLCTDGSYVYVVFTNANLKKSATANFSPAAQWCARKYGGGEVGAQIFIDPNQNFTRRQRISLVIYRTVNQDTLVVEKEGNAHSVRENRKSTEESLPCGYANSNRKRITFFVQWSVIAGSAYERS